MKRKERETTEIIKETNQIISEIGDLLNGLNKQQVDHILERLQNEVYNTSLIFTKNW